MKNKVYFSHIPKTAGITLEAVVFYAGENINEDYIIGEGYFRKFIKTKHKKYYNYFLKKKYLDLLIKNNKNHWNMVFWHIPLSFWKNEILLEYKKNFRIFLTVRNPYDKIVSDFKYWIKFYNNLITLKNKNNYKHLLNQIKDIYENNFELSAENMNKIITKLLTNKKYKYSLDGHLIHQYKYIYTIIDGNLIKIPDTILRFENLNNDFIKFKNKYMPLITNNAFKNTHLNPSISNLDSSSLTYDVKNLIFNYYKVDFKILDYKKM